MRVIFFLTIFLTFASCQQASEDGFIDLGSGDGSGIEQDTTMDYIVIGSRDATHRGYAIYTTDGEFVDGGHFKAEAANPVGLAKYGPDSFLVSTENMDTVYRVGFDGTREIFHGSGQLTGNLFGVVRAPGGNVYAVESNNIEVFSPNGNLLVSHRIATTVGACQLSAPRQLAISPQGHLVVSSWTNGRILTYDISTLPVTCVSTVTVGSQPDGLLFHSNGSLYIVQAQNHRILRADPDGNNSQVIWNTNTTIINTPTGLAEHPNGDILVASSALDTIERLTPDGVRVGTMPFLYDIYTRNIADIIVMEGPTPQ